MKLIIDISDKTYEIIRDMMYFYNSQRSGRGETKEIITAIKQGIPLPKGHGDLVTKEQMIELVEFYQINPQHFNFINLIDDIKDEKPIIEADKGE